MTGLRRRVHHILLAVACWSGTSSLQAQHAALAVHYPLRLVDLTIVADTISGLQLLVLPGATTEQGRKEATLVWLRFDADSALSWLNGAAAALRFPIGGGPANAIQWSPALHAVDGRGALALGRNRKKGVLSRGHYLAFSDSLTGWQTEIDAVEADSLLRLFLSLASQSRIDTSAALPPDRDHVDRQATVIHQGKPAWSGTYGYVVAQYVIGIDGRVEPESFLVLWSASPRIEAEARELVRTARFGPAQKGGQPVRQLVRQIFVWRPR